MKKVSATPVMHGASRIGIVNRGEAALRLIRAVREFNELNKTELESVALYIEKEAHAPFVKAADDAVALSSVRGYPGKQQSPYLDHELIVEALKTGHCDAIWVGWGFVSEDSEFVRKIEALGIVLLGPTSEAMALLGDKIAAKELAEKADVPILPWSRSSVDGIEDARKISENIGYPVIVKAANAGGGRGIRFVKNPEELETQFLSAREETIRITGNAVVFIEALVERGRHLEVQVLADWHGNINTFGVRDCSVQRKNQKIIEETPPPLLDEQLTLEMQASAARLIKAAGYTGAGTVEYLYDLDRKEFFFMEVNTRLQVEHPITETLFGIDLVKGQIAVALGEQVNWMDKEPRGHVMEVRLNAEDPDREFSPAPGRVDLFKPPAGPGIRIDSGVEQGSEIPSDFDSMIAKIIAHGQDRAEAMARLKLALRELRIKIDNGTTNRSFVLDLLENKSVIDGGVHTGFVEEMIGIRMERQDKDKTRAALLAGAIELYFRRLREEFINFREQLNRAGRPRNVLSSTGYEVSIGIGDNSYDFLVKGVGKDWYHLRHKGNELSCHYVPMGQEGVLQFDGKSYSVLIIPRGENLQCEIDGYPVMLESESGGYLTSPSPAMVLSVNVKPDQPVAKGDILIVLEAMKMEMLIEAPANGIVKELSVVPGSQVAGGQPLIRLELGEDEKERPTPSVSPLVFPSSSKEDDKEWSRLSRNFLALFYGYDTEDALEPAVDQILDFTKRNSGYSKQAVQTFMTGLSLLYKIERLFSRSEVESKSFSRPVSYQELLSHYFRRSEDKEKGLPDQFISMLKNMADCYPPSRLDEGDSIDISLFLAFRSHAKLAVKQKQALRVLFSLEDLGVEPALHRELAVTLDGIIRLYMSTAQSLADAAFHARYRIIDAAKVEDLRQHNRQLLSELTGNAAVNTLTGSSLAAFIDGGPQIMHDLLEVFGRGDEQVDIHVLKILAERQNRDRSIIKSHEITIGGVHLRTILSSTHEGDVEGLYALVGEPELKGELPVQDWLNEADLESTAEVTIFVTGTWDKVSLDKVFGNLKISPFKAGWVSVGIFSPDRHHSFRTYQWEDKIAEIPLRRGFSPLQFRELRVFRLQEFSVKTLYENCGVFLLEATAKNDPKDVRLMGFADVAEIEPELNDDEDINRLVLFEAGMMEAIHAMRAVQAQYRYRLQWNRIIIYNRTLLGIGFRQLRAYGKQLTAWSRDLGLEKLSVYTRRKRWSESVIRELELTFQSLTQDQYNVRVRRPKNDPFEPLDAYASKALRARQRNTIYPYEIIKMLTTAGFSPDGITPRGDFEEFDIEYDRRSQKQSPVSVNGREPGLNRANIVFGIIENQNEYFDFPLRRVLILGDSTRDMGSLAEPECRRINAAIDLAEQQGIPIEWIPISSGAKITMDSGTENLDWTATTLKRIIEFTQSGGEINIIVPGINVGAQSYWDAEATMLMHTRGLLIMTEDGAMLLTGKKALDFSGSVSGETNLDIGGAEKIMGPNGQAQVKVPNLAAAYQALFEHYRYTYTEPGKLYPRRRNSCDPVDRDLSTLPYNDFLNQGFSTIGDIFSEEKNGDRKKPFDVRQVMEATIDDDASYFERWRVMGEADTSIVWETQIGGYPVGMIGIESRPLDRVGAIPFDGPESWTGGTLFPQSSKKVARGLNAFSGRLPLVVVANLSGFDGSPESLRKLQLEYGAEIGRAVVNFKGPICFIVISRYHGGAYVVFSKSLNPNIRTAALEGSYASVIGGAPAAAVVFPRDVLKETYSDSRIVEMNEQLEKGLCSQKDFETQLIQVNNEKQAELAGEFDQIHSVERAKEVGSIDDIITVGSLRPYIIGVIERGIRRSL